MPVTSNATTSSELTGKYNATPAKDRNILDRYKSYTYRFTLAALKETALNNPLSYRENADYFVIAKSGGKGTQGMSVSNIAANNNAAVDYVNAFNQKSPGRFDFYIDNVNISTIMGFDTRTSLSVATNIDFEILEPYSMSGFIEALQAAAVAAGYSQYALAPFLLKVEFLGYPDDQMYPTIVQIPNSVRYFVFAFTGLEITVNESGAKYRCKGVPFNERAFGEPSQLKSNIQIHGTTVGEILTSFQDEINSALKNAAESEKSSTVQQTGRDIYEIVIPEITENGFNINGVNKDIADKKLLEVMKDKAVYKFATPDDAKNTSVKYDPKTPVISFAERANIHECIVAIIRDSQYTKDILKTYPKCVDEYGYVNYFIVNLEVEELKEFDKTKNKPFYKYRYIVLPYKIHCTRIPLVQNDAIDVSKLKININREYEYLYTGKNVDIKNLELKFNTLYFQAIPNKLGNKEDTPSQADGIKPADTTLLRATEVNSNKEVAQSQSPVRHDVRQTQVHVGNTLNALPPQVDPYSAMAKNLHQAILDNVDQCTITMELLGDPYYLVTGGIGNYRPDTNADNTVGHGEAPYLNRDVVISIKFKNPIDIDPVTGEAIFDNSLSVYSGVFRVITVDHKFTGGVFTQQLKAIRIPAQIYNTTTSTQALTAMVAEDIDSTNNTCPAPVATPALTRRSESALLSDIIKSVLPSAGLPGSLSTLVADAKSGLTDTLGQLTNGAQSLASDASAFTGMSGISTAIRLTQSGLTDASSNINSAGATINQVAKTAASLGFKDASKIASLTKTAADLTAKATTALDTTLPALTSKADQLSSSAMSAIDNLDSKAAGLISGVESKIDALTNAQSALTAQLGSSLNKLSGLTGDLQSKIQDAISTAAKQVPSDVDLNSSIKNGLILDNIPLTSLANIPATQPMLIAPTALLPDVTATTDSLLNSPVAKLASGLGADTTAIAGKLSSMQSELQSVAGDITSKVNSVQAGVIDAVKQVESIESKLNAVAAKLPGNVQIPNVSSVATSVVNKYGSVSGSSPLDSIMKKIT